MCGAGPAERRCGALGERRGVGFVGQRPAGDADGDRERPGPPLSQEGSGEAVGGAGPAAGLGEGSRLAHEAGQGRGAAREELGEAGGVRGGQVEHGVGPHRAVEQRRRAPEDLRLRPPAPTRRVGTGRGRRRHAVKVRRRPTWIGSGARLLRAAARERHRGHGSGPRDRATRVTSSRARPPLKRRATSRASSTRACGVSSGSLPRACRTPPIPSSSVLPVGRASVSPSV